MAIYKRGRIWWIITHDRGGMAEWLKAAVLKNSPGVFAKPLKIK